MESNKRVFYLYDTPYQKIPLTIEQKKVSNLVFRFKEGKSSQLVAKIFSLAISRMNYFSELSDPILIPIPASTKERHLKRFASLCFHLSRRLGVPDGFRAIWINKDRSQLKGVKGVNRLSHVEFNPKYIYAKYIILIDDILTTGETFIQIKHELEKLAAKSVTGLFLGKTID